jgi:hypothetical protein
MHWIRLHGLAGRYLYEFVIGEGLAEQVDHCGRGKERVSCTARLLSISLWL